MAATLPYMLSTGLIPRILEKIQHARRPDRFTQDFLETKLGHGGGSARPIISLLKRMGFLGSDGVPTSLYDQFRNTETQGFAIANGMKNAFSELFDRNEYVYEMPREKFAGLVVEITGNTKESSRTRGIIGTFLALKELANFEDDVPPPTPHQDLEETSSTALPVDPRTSPATVNGDSIKLQLGYTINLNLPETTNPEVFNAIFKALKENLLRG